MDIKQTVIGVEAPREIYPEREVEELDEEIEESQEHLSVQELIVRYAEIQGITVQQAKEQIGADTPEEVLKNIQDKTVEKINSTRAPMNRAQRRALKKKMGAKAYAEMVSQSGDEIAAINETAKKLNYINLIQKLRELNERNERNGETIVEDD